METVINTIDITASIQVDGKIDQDLLNTLNNCAEVIFPQILTLAKSTAPDTSKKPGLNILNITSTITNEHVLNTILLALRHYEASLNNQMSNNTLPKNTKSTSLIDKVPSISEEIAVAS